ncbi:E3 ubiquitin-protein ligase TRIM17 [Hondaea fermentalgiana]|uniref:E3 ubiquitin-protein ligase TRIM17 n=1 Tax=Hondaea fermentalgiana TaxID=2315210 RepID=A0A2R5G470_9STRA|nr:E3 ubiquitin-protein ligase TRIM17 [Hondaea fermentalgiana]|eukprot:GBG25790.1 E3 ubiquitin-protein ligase TRIM17 [Hondaea fermentalgiana]
MGAPQEASQDASRPRLGPVLAPLEQTASLDRSSTGAQMPISSQAPSREATPTRQANGASVGGAAVGGATVDGAAEASGDSQTNAPMSPQTANRKMAPRQLFKRMNEKLVLHQQLLLQVPKRGGPQQLDKDAEEHVTCSICLNTYDEPVKTSCGHIFCRKCLEQTKQHHLQQQQQQQQQRTTQALRHEQLQTLQIRLPRAAGHVVSQRLNPVRPQMQPRTQLQSQAQAQVPQHQAVHPPATAANGAGSVLPGLNTSCEWRSLKKDLQAHLEVCPYHAIRRFYPLVFGKLEHVHSLTHELQATIATHEEVFRHQLRHLVQLKHLDITSFRDNLRMLGLYFWWPQRLVRTQAQWFQFSVFLQISLLFLWPLLACTYIVAGGSIHAGDAESFFRIPANASMTLKDLWAEGVAHASNFTRSPAISPTAFLPEILGTTGNPMRIGLCDAAIFPEWSCIHIPVVLVLLCSFVLLEVGLLEGSHSEHKLRIKIYNTAQPNTNGARPSRVEVGPSVAESNAPQGARAWRFVIREQIAPLEVLLSLVVCLLFSQLSLGYQIVLAVAFLPGLCLHETVADHNFVRPVLAGAFVGFQCAWVHPRVLVATNILAIVHTPYCPVFAEDDAFASRVRLASVGLMHLALPEVYFMGFALSTGLFYAGRTGLPALRRRLQSSINEASPDPVCQGVLALGLTAQAMLTWKTLLVAIERTLVYSTA